MSVLDLQALCWQGPGFELRADLALSEGQWVELQGPSGGGKTSFLRLLAGLVKPGKTLAYERWELGGVPFWKQSPYSRGLGWVTQEASLFPGLSVWKNAAFGLRVRGMSWRQARMFVLPWLEQWGLGGRAEGSVAVLSGGEAARVALVRALVFKPRLLLLDEAFSALDPALTARVEFSVREWVAQTGAACVCVRHGQAAEAHARFEMQNRGTQRVLARIK